MSKFSFRGGIHPLHDIHGGKSATREKPIRAFLPGSVTIPVNMHLGTPSVPCVKKGERVLLGQVIAEPAGSRGIPVHASVSGEVTAVGPKQSLGRLPVTCITIANDEKDEWAVMQALGDVETATPDKIIARIRDAGICGMGGACFPTHAKMTIPAGKTIDTILLNGAECETFLNADYRLMLEQPKRVVDGLRAAMRAMNVKRGIIAIEDNKMEAVAAMQQGALGREGVEIAVLRTKYPQGGEKQLIEAVLNREVPSGGLPMDVNVVVLNVATAAAITDAVVEGKPCISRVTTVAGAVNDPANLLLRVGTSVADVASACGGYTEEPGKIFMGGSMTGICIPDDSVPMTKANNGIVVLTRKQAELPTESACIRCAKCIDACPVRLDPTRLRSLIDLDKLEEAKKEHVMDCIVCGACSYVCPAKRWLAPAIKDAKERIAEGGK
ncbi:MAG: electron transport complex subunit RsxC [Eubacteriales bacterium]|nr:electron transport complex subunit RsxC [Eubacteriales bacterium]MDD4104698.1 electron transport complex subunit RsxC [Eubacteriales bacterium]MDD4710278.1 electron transport complex subunit RsxC [Eubacteriales bacterium]NLO15269.1 electron transport complex subunit RsxC [Clostridiales bacterium]